MDNLVYYNKLRTVPQEAQKEIKGGKLKGMTDINPMWRIKALTETFGPAGEGWVISNVKFWTETAAQEVVVNCSLELRVKLKEGMSEPIFGIGGNKLYGKGVGEGINDEAYKMAYTDAISVACKALGMAADIYFSKDRTKYTIQEENASSAVSARRSAASRSEYKPMSDAQYWAIIKEHALGHPTRTGGDYRETWIATTNAGAEQISRFDEDVINYKTANGIR